MLKKQVTNSQLSEIFILVEENLIGLGKNSSILNIQTFLGIRVTSMGTFSLIGRLLPFVSFMTITKVAQIFGYFLTW
jgi:hypothetical protein